MGYNFTIKGGVRVKKDGHYPWPLAGRPAPAGRPTEGWAADPGRTIELSTDDVLTKDPNTGKYMVHIGIGCFGIVLKDDEVEPIGKDVNLRLM